MHMKHGVRSTQYGDKRKITKRSPFCVLRTPYSARGFTLVELLVSVGIFVAMTALFTIRYGTFNQSVLHANLAYDVALTIRTAQTYGLSIKSTGSGGGTFNPAVFQSTYGVSFSTVAPYNSRMILYSSAISKPPALSDYQFNHDDQDVPAVGDAIISKFLLKRGAVISRLCVGSGSCDTEVNELSVNFKRPDPSATICAGNIDFGLGTNTVTCAANDTYAEIDVSSTDGKVRTIQVRSNGQISVLN